MYVLLRFPPLPAPSAPLSLSLWREINDQAPSSTTGSARWQAKPVNVAFLQACSLFSLVFSRVASARGLFSFELRTAP